MKSIGRAEMRPRAESDEHYLLDLCDQVLCESAKRGYRFPFLLGDPGKHGPARLPVDAFYEKRNLVIEYRERQHYESVGHFDKPDRMTVSGVHRGEQRKRYDKRRHEVLPKQGINIVVLRYDEFRNEGKKLKRVPEEDREVIRKALAPFIETAV